MKKTKKETSKYIVTGQMITEEKRRCAIKLRQEMTPAEIKLWKFLKGGRLGGFHFRRQQIIEGSSRVSWANAKVWLSNWMDLA